MVTSVQVANGGAWPCFATLLVFLLIFFVSTGGLFSYYYHCSSITVIYWLDTARIT